MILNFNRNKYIFNLKKKKKIIILNPYVIE